MSAPAIVTVAHGSRFADGNAVAVAITDAVRALWAGPVHGTYVELADPVFDADAAAGQPAVVVPLLLSAGFHICSDIPGRAGPQMRFAPSLGPDPAITAVQVERLREAGATPGAPVTMVATGSNHAGAQEDLEVARTLLEEAWGAPVRLASMTGAGRRPAEVVEPGDAVSPYLLAPGHFSRQLRAQSLEAGAAVVAEVMGAHPAFAQLVVERAGGPFGRRPCDLIGRCASPIGCLAPSS